MKNILQGILRFPRISKNANREAIQRLQVTIMQCGKGPTVALSNAVKELLVRRR
jgi:hypothetical protein